MWSLRCVIAWTLVLATMGNATYNSLPDLEAAMQKFRSQAAGSVEEVVDNSSLPDVLSVGGFGHNDWQLWLPHRHHNVIGGQFVVEVFNTSARTDGALLSWAQPRNCTREDVVPTKFTLHEVGSRYVLVAREYAWANSPEGRWAATMVQKQIGQPEFIGAMGAAIKRAGLLGSIGLCIGMAPIVKHPNLIEVESNTEDGTSMTHLRYAAFFPNTSSDTVATSWTMGGLRQRGCRAGRVCVRTNVYKHRSVVTHVR